MKTTPIEDIFELEPKETVTRTQGKLTKLYKPKTGESSHGPWSIQKGMIKDGSGEISVMFKDRDEVPQAWRDREIIITSHKSDKGWSGVYAEDDNYKGTTTRILKVTGSAIVEVEGDAPQTHAANQKSVSAHDYEDQGNMWEQEEKEAAQQAQQAPKQAPEQAPEIPKQAPKQAHKHGTSNVYAEASRSLLQIINFHAKCAAGVLKYESGLVKGATGKDMTESERQGAIASVFIQGCRQGLHNAMPTKALTPEEL